LLRVTTKQRPAGKLPALSLSTTSARMASGACTRLGSSDAALDPTVLLPPSSRDYRNRVCYSAHWCYGAAGAVLLGVLHSCRPVWLCPAAVHACLPRATVGRSTISRCGMCHNLQQPAAAVACTACVSAHIGKVMAHSLGNAVDAGGQTCQP